MMELLKVFEAFSGVGAQRMALRNIGIEHEVVAISEIDKYAIQSYEAIHGKTFNLGDISKIDPKDIPDHDLFTYSFPCTDVSTSGRQLGFAKGSGTRSGLLWECEKVINIKRPKYLLLENVKGLISNKFRAGFDEWLSLLEGYGYTNYWGILNSKHYGVAQNRERVFVVSILGEHEPYLFPNLCGSIKPLREILEDDVTDRYTLSELKHNRFVYDPNLKNDIKTLGSSKAKESRIGQRDIIYSVDGIMGAIMA